MNTQNKNFKGKGFYVALVICLTAITAASWSTYKSVKNFSSPSKSDVSKKNSSIPDDRNPKVTNEIVSKKFAKDKSKPEEKPSNSDSAKGPQKITQSPQPAQDDTNLQSVATEQVDTLIIYPTDKTVIKEFSDGKPVYSNTLGDWRTHDGIDFKAGQGSIVKSISAGTVKDVYNDSAYGTTVVIDHNTGFTAYYCGLGATTLVKKGETVKSGQDIGSIKSVPIEIAEEPHLHLMIRKGEKFIDPMLVLEQDK